MPALEERRLDKGYALDCVESCHDLFHIEPSQT